MTMYEPHTVAEHNIEKQPDGTFSRQHTFAKNITPNGSKNTWVFQRPDGPVEILHDPSTGRTVERWAVFASGRPGVGNIRLDREDGPAEIIVHKDGRTEENWRRGGKPYQPSAHERMRWEARKLAQGTPFHADTLHALAGGDPPMGAAGENWMKTTGVKQKKAAFHRIGAPAMIRRDPATGATVRTTWFKHGYPHRDDNKPYDEVFQAATGFRVEATYATDKKIGQWGAPARFRWNPANGKVIEEEWIRGGVYFRPNGPAMVKQDPATGEIFESRWFENGKRRAHPSDAPYPDWEAKETRQGGPFTPGFDQAPAAQRPDGVKAAAAAAQTARATTPKADAHGQER